MDHRTAIYRYCNYQDRSQQEVRDKLYSLGAHSSEVEQLIAELIESGILNEERFARAFARGKFRIKHWGRIKITQQLKQHRISPYLLAKAMKEIDASEYFATCSRLAGRKWESLKTEKSPYEKRAKVFRYLQQKGYESTIISEVLQDLLTVE